MDMLDRVIATPRHVLASVTFLSRLPTWRLIDDGKPDFSTSAHAFPLSGWIIALVPLCVALIAHAILPVGWTTALVLLAAMMLTTGALHEDGLADVADGFWGGHTRERKLAIMRDSSIGTYGTLALIVVMAFRCACLATALTFEPLAFALAYGAICSLSRAAMLVTWALLPAARPNDGEVVDGKTEAGLSARYGGPDKASLMLAAVWSVPGVTILVTVSPLAIPTGAAALGAIIWLAKRHIGGHTGDVLGATQQLVEVGLLFGLAAAISAP